MKRVISLKSGWQLRQLRKCGPLDPREVKRLCKESSGDPTDWLPAEVPAQVHDILFRAGRIENPALVGNVKKCLWVAEHDWVYKKAISPARDGKRVYLHFRGLDTLVEVYLNCKQLAFHCDMYLPLRLDVTDDLKDDANLLLHFHSPHSYLQKCTLPAEWQVTNASGEAKIARHKVLRKQPEDFSAFLGAKPYFTKMGIYDEVHLEVADVMEIGHIDLRYRLSASYDRAVVDLRANGVGFEEGAQLQMILRDPNGQVVTERGSEVQPSQDRGWQMSDEFGVETPELWWPRGYGRQPLYEMTVRLAARGQTFDEKTRRIGFRDLRMGDLFDFSLNGRRIKLYGANLAPINGATHCWDSQRFLRIMDLVEMGNMNILRAWGPGAPYHEQLYDEADRRGLLIWHDFFHTWGMYPDTEEFRALCRQEAEHYVRTLKHHPCILLWCGGNESHMGAELDFSGEPFIGREIFEEDYPAICKELDPDRYYHPNSPYGGSFLNDPSSGDVHGWSETFYIPGERYPVLYSELARINTPLLKSLKRIIGDKALWPERFTGTVKPRRDATLHEVPESWRKIALDSLPAFMMIDGAEKFYDTGDSPEGLIYRIGAARSLYLRESVERFRRGRPAGDVKGQRRCMGAIVWKLNNTWPQIGHHIIDYFQEPNMAYYAVRRAFAPVLLSFDVEDHIYLWVVNDSPEEVRGTVVFRLFDPLFRNETLKEIKKEVSVSSGQSAVVMGLDELGMFLRSCILFAFLMDGEGRIVTRSNDFVDVERKMVFPEAKLSLNEDDGVLRITTDCFARSIELQGNHSGDEFGWYFEDNFFDLLPGEIKEVRMLGKHRSDTVTAKSFFSRHIAETGVGDTK